ncbi:MAG TPA: hypothetical protein VFE47_19735 [Tepidisphaeraceae bacterium]|jgi:hypothetical protein|nr:hypothetical protein [Tepidisphaeraceae bacterium]
MNESIQVLSITCDHCGAPLEVPPGTRFVTCRYCNSRLEIHQNGGAAYTEVLEAIDERTQHIAEDVETIKLQNQLNQLDREWMVDRENYAIRNKQGHSLPPTTGGGAGAIFGLVFASVFIVIWIIASASMGAPFFFPLFGVGMLVMIFIGVISSLKKTGDYRNALGVYERRRQKLLNALRDRGQ